MSTIRIKYTLDGKPPIDIEFTAKTWKAARQKESKFFENKEFVLIQRVIVDDH